MVKVKRINQNGNFAFFQKIMLDTDNTIEVQGARVHNLKNIDVSIPREKLVVITGLSGSGKSSLAFDTIYAEGQRRYVETFSAYARQFLGGLERPDVDKIDGLSPVIAIEQKTTSKSPRSTVGTIQKFMISCVCFMLVALTHIVTTLERKWFPIRMSKLKI
jgi:excinuclease ABC subunit A